MRFIDFEENVVEYIPEGPIENTSVFTPGDSLAPN